MSNQSRSLDRITIPKPCNADWDSMTGNDQVRFCEHCSLQVTDLSALTRQAAMRLVARSQGRLCVRYVQGPGGGVLTRQMPQKLFRISRRVSRIAAGAFTATLSLASVGAQTGSGSSPQALRPTVSATQLVSPVELGASLAGVITDPNGAVVPGAILILTNSQSHAAFTYTTGEDGAYKFSLLEGGLYSITVEAPSFAKTEMTDLELRTGATRTINLSMELPALTAEVQIVSQKVAPVVMGGVGGVMMMRMPEEPLVKAAYQNDLAAVKVLALTSSDVNLNDAQTRMNALAYATENGNREIIQVLLAAGADVNARTQSGETPLMYIRDKASVDVVRDLISAGADVNARDESGDTPLLSVAARASLAVINELIAAGGRMDARNNYDETVLMNAAENEDPEVALLLIKAGVDITLKSASKETALIRAARWGNAATVKALVEARSEIDAKDSDGKTALMFAAGNDDPNIARILLDAGADVNTRDTEGSSPLIVAAGEGKVGVVKLLIERGAVINAKDSAGQTALMHAELDVTLVLLNAGADPNLKDNDGQTALSLAREADDEDLIKLLVSRGARA